MRRHAALMITPVSAAQHCCTARVVPAASLHAAVTVCASAAAEQ